MKTIAKLNQQDRNEQASPIQAILIPLLESLLPTWKFQPYGKDNAVACYPAPPRYTGPEAYSELNRFAIGARVCGPFYVVTQLRTAKPIETMDALKADNARLREALQAMLDWTYNQSAPLETIREAARSAIAQAKGQGKV